jgi:phosphoglycolate phosphatase-like HAD superfamily hydrolase
VTDPAGPVVGFDLDMTLVDSAAGIAATLQAALGELGRHVTADRLWPLVGVPLEIAIAEVAPDVDAHAVTRRYRELYATHGVPPITLLPGAREAFDAVHALGGRVLVVSAKIEAAVRAVLTHVGLDRTPHAPDVVAGGLFGAAKGTVLRAAGAVAYVGDHPGDVEAARAGGAVSVGVATGPYLAADLRSAGADVVLADLRAFPAWLRGHVAVGGQRTA